MSALGLTMKRSVMGGVAMAAVFCWLTPARASAGTPVATAVIYEVNEGLRLVKARKADPAAGFTQRIAKASLLGKPEDLHALSPDSPFTEGSFVSVDATSNVSLATGHGPIQGKLNLMVDLDPTRESLDTLSITSGFLISGDLNLTTAQQGFATMSGTWQQTMGKKKNQREGTFKGTFLIPFKYSDGKYYYVNLAADGGAGNLCSAGICPLEDDEFTLGFPVTKTLVTFFE